MQEGKDNEKTIEAIPVDDIFLQAAKETTERSITITERKTSVTPTNDKPLKKVKTWSQLKKAIDTDHAARFNDVLSSLPDRDFVAAYLKSLEFFRPKVVRKGEEAPKEVDNKIEIVVNRGNKKNE